MTTKNFGNRSESNSLKTHCNQKIHKYTSIHLYILCIYTQYMYIHIWNICLYTLRCMFIINLGMMCLILFQLLDTLTKSCNTHTHKKKTQESRTWEQLEKVTIKNSFEVMNIIIILVFIMNTNSSL